MKTYYKTIAVVSVEERLPQTKGKYTVHGYNGGEPFTTESEFIIPSGKYGNSIKRGFMHCGVTHWEEGVKNTYTKEDVVSILSDYIFDKINVDDPQRVDEMIEQSEKQAKEWFNENIK